MAMGVAVVRFNRAFERLVHVRQPRQNRPRQSRRNRIAKREGCRDCFGAFKPSGTWVLIEKVGAIRRKSVLALRT